MLTPADSRVAIKSAETLEAKATDSKIGWSDAWADVAFASICLGTMAMITFIMLVTMAPATSRAATRPRA